VIRLLTHFEAKLEACTSTGCRTCGWDVETEEDILRAAKKNLEIVVRAAKHFGWDTKKLLEECEKELNPEE